MSNPFYIPKIISSQKISGLKEFEKTKSKLINHLEYKKIKKFGSNHSLLRTNEPILFTFDTFNLNRIQGFNNKKIVRFISNKVQKLTSIQEKIKKTLETVPVYTVVDEKDNLVINAPHSFLEFKKESQNNWEIPITFSFLDKKNADFYCDDLNEDFRYLNKSFTVRTINLGFYYELIYTQGSKNLFYLFPDLDEIKNAKKFLNLKKTGVGIPSFGYKHLSIKNKKGEVWDGKFLDFNSDERITPVFLSYSDALTYWKKFRKLELDFKLPKNPPVEYLKLENQIFRTSELDFLNKNFLFFPSTKFFQN